MRYDLLAEIEQDTRLKRTSSSRGGQYNGPCPWCGGLDRFRVQPHYGAYGFFACNQCRRSGTAIDYLMLRRGYSKQYALATVGWKPKDGRNPSYSIPYYAQQSCPHWEEPPEQWQHAAMAFYQACQRALWSERGRAALDYLRRRGLSDETIRKASLGYHPGQWRAPANQWGRRTWLAQGIVIPWLIEGGIWRLTIRDERVIEGNRRYLQVSGGSNGLYLVQSLLLKRPAVVLTEGEFDALSIAQECGDLVAVVATGTTKGSHTPRWISFLAQQGRVFVAFDAERDKGDVDAQWWTRRLGNAQRLRPLWNDANQMLQDGVNLREWISAALAKTAAPVGMPSVEIDKGPMQAQPAPLTHHVFPSAHSSCAGPQIRCPFVHTVVDREGHIKGAPCQGKALASSGWCAEHQQAQTLLDLGMQLGYPRTQLTRHRAIGAGRGSWEAYACRAPARWLGHDLPFIRSHYPNGASGTPVKLETRPINAHERIEGGGISKSEAR
jgi:DNA primase